MRLAAQQQEREQGRARQKQGLKAEGRIGAFKHDTEFRLKNGRNASNAAMLDPESAVTGPRQPGRKARKMTERWKAVPDSQGIATEVAPTVRGLAAVSDRRL